MKCPYCGEELKEWDRRLYCENMACSANHEDLPQFIWQALIDGKKAQDELERTRNALDIAVDALKEMIDWDKCVAMQSNDFVGMAEKALEQITTLEQKD